MDITDQAGFPHRVYRGVIDGERLFAALVVKTSWTVGDGRISLDAVQDWPVFDAPKPTPAGVIPSDQCFYKAGADVMVIGQASAAEPVERLPVGVAIGTAFRADVMAIGRRTWRKRLLRGLEISPPEPFTTMPLTLHQAFGGKVMWDGLPIPYPDNPDGIGYYVDAAGADGGPLPTVEDPAHPITQWDDRPEPVGLGLRPPAFGPHVRRAVGVDAKGHITRLDPLFFNNAFPACVAREPAAGQPVMVTGMTPGAGWSFPLPACPLRAGLMLGGAFHELPLRYDQIWLEPATNKVLIAWRSPFRYQLRPLERRRITLERTANGSAASLQSVAAPATTGGRR